MSWPKFVCDISNTVPTKVTEVRSAKNGAMTGWPTEAKLENDDVVIGPPKVTMPFSMVHKLLTAPVPKSIEKPSGISTLDALFSRFKGQDSANVDPATQAPLPSPTVLVPKSSPSLLGPKSMLTCLA